MTVFTKAELDQTASGRKSLGVPVVEGWKDGALTVFVAGRPRNPSNGSHEHWSKHARWAKQWRDRAQAAMLTAADHGISCVTRHTIGPKGPAIERWRWPWTRYQPKQITFTIYAAGRYDDDNLRLVAKPCRDALRDMFVIDDDKDSSGHTFLYAQSPSRKKGAVLGIAIRIHLAQP